MRGRAAHPSAGIMESQSVQTTGGGGARGDEGAKQLKGRQRHVLVETPGFVRTVPVHPAAVLERAGGTRLLPPEPTTAQLPRLAQGWLEAGSKGRGKGKEWRETPVGWTTPTVRPPARRVSVLEDVEPAPRPAFTVRPRRWVVERTCSWWGQRRRRSKEDERLCASSEARIYVGMSRLMVRRVAAA
jgi:putative transposase